MLTARRRSRMAAVARNATAVLTATPILLSVGAADARAEVSCSLRSGTLSVRMDERFDSAQVGVADGRTIRVRDDFQSGDPVACDGQRATTRSVKRIRGRDVGDTRTSFALDRPQLLRAPGRGGRRIDVDVDLGTRSNRFYVTGGAADDHYVFGRAGLNVDPKAAGDPRNDVDVTLSGIRRIDAEGGAGVDRLSAAGGFGTGRPAASVATFSADSARGGSAGGPKKQLLAAGNRNAIFFAGPQSDRVLGGRGDDILYGQRGDDLLDGGPGDDRFIAGAGDDRIDAGDGERDASVKCGIGRDRAVLDPGDGKPSGPKGCEKLYARG